MVFIFENIGSSVSCSVSSLIVSWECFSNSDIFDIFARNCCCKFTLNLKIFRVIARVYWVRTFKIGLFGENRMKISKKKNENIQIKFRCKIRIRGNIHFIFLLSRFLNPRFNSDEIKFSGSTSYRTSYRTWYSSIQYKRTFWIAELKVIPEKVKKLH